MNPARVFLVDDHPLMCEGIRLILEKESDLMVVGQAHNGEAAQAKFRSLRPDLTVMDIDLGDADGIAVASQLLAEFPESRFIILSASPDTELIRRAVQAGMQGYLLKAKATEELLQAMRAVLAGNSYLCSEASNAIVSDYRKLLTQATPPARPELTERELEVLKLTAEGLRVKEIASRLNIGIKTVDTHRSNLLAKLGCSSASELTRYAIRKGIISI